jgi:hypothetical protein
MQIILKQIRWTRAVVLYRQKNSIGGGAASDCDVVRSTEPNLVLKEKNAPHM